ncbi:MAG TPA: NAD(P)/FAD-dependent oxidoreductase, partial [bacterium]|nr:NAD(P)/FAD-dependent oxidoreductase [bacterium]
MEQEAHIRCAPGNGRKKVLILGGGFAGVHAAIDLEKSLGPNPDVEITLVNRENFFLFTPMLHEVAASDLDITNIVSPVRKLLKKAQFFEGVVEKIDLGAKQVIVSHGYDSHTHALGYDHLVIGLGAVTNFYNLPGLAENALTMKSLGDAIHLRNRLIQHLEEADTECAAKDREALLTFVVAGGGFAGVETIAAVSDFAHEALPSYANLKKDLLRFVLVHPGSVILPELGEKLGAYAQKKLAQRGIEIRSNAKVTGMKNHIVELSDGASIKTFTLVWTAGVSANPLLEQLPCGKERGRVLVDEYLEVPDHPGVWVVGDSALIKNPKTGEYYPPTAQHAQREGTTVAHNIAAAVSNKPGEKKPFAFSALGQLAAIGKRTGVANILGINFSGFIAWWLWRSIYLSKLPRLKKKVRVAFDWTLDLI